MSEKRQESIDLLNSTHDFPQAVMVKVIGQNTPEFEQDVRSVLSKQLNLTDELKLKKRETKGGRHVALTMEPAFESAEQVLDLYEQLRNVRGLVMLL